MNTTKLTVAQYNKLAEVSGIYISFLIGGNHYYVTSEDDLFTMVGMSRVFACFNIKTESQLTTEQVLKLIQG